MDSDLLLKALRCSQVGQDYCFATVIESTLKGTPRKAGAKMLVLADGSAYGTIGGGRNEKYAQEECLKAIKTGKSKIVTYDYFGKKGQSICGGQIKVFIEPSEKNKQLIICGGGHIGLSLSILAKMLRFNVTILDNRKEFCNKKRFSHADKIILGDYAEKLKKMGITDNSYIMIVTQGNEYDYACLKAVIHSRARYIGVISSKAKRIKFLNRLKEDGVSSQKLKKIDIPAGVDIGAQTPDEIAISISSEMIKKERSDSLNTDKFKEKERTYK